MTSEHWDAGVFMVRRAGEWWDADMPPCDVAVRTPIPRYDTRTCSPEEFDRKDLGRGTPWHETGSDHERLPNGYSRRRMEDYSAWTLEASPAVLVALAETYGSVTIEPREGPLQPPHLTLGWSE